MATLCLISTLAKLAVSVLLLLAQILFFGTTSVDAYGFKSLSISPGRISPSVPVTTFGEENNLTYLLSPKPILNEVVLEQAIQLLKAADSAPSCSRQAAARLITSCQSLDGEGHSGEDDSSTDVLDAIKSTYAARLAICELQHAGHTLPPPCAPVISVHPSETHISSGSTNNVRSSDEAEQLNTKDLAPCLKALGTKPQSWTSYSNNRQNAVIMCYAVRPEIEKERLLNIYGTAAQITSQLNNLVSDLLQKVSVHHEDQVRFADDLKSLHDQQVDDMEQAHLQNKDRLGQIMTDFDSRIYRAGGKMEASMRAADDGAGIMKQTLEGTIERVLAVDRNITKIFHSILSGTTEMVATHVKQFAASHDLAEATQRSLQGINIQELALAKETLNEVYGIVVSISPLVQSLHQNYDVLNDGFERLESVFKQVSHIQASQMRTSRLQQEVQEDIYEKMLTSGASLEVMTTGIEKLNTDLRNIIQAISSAEMIFIAVKRSPWGIIFLFPFSLLLGFRPQIPVMILMVLAFSICCWFVELGRLITTAFVDFLVQAKNWMVAIFNTITHTIYTHTSRPLAMLFLFVVGISLVVVLALAKRCCQSTFPRSGTKPPSPAKAPKQYLSRDLEKAILSSRGERAVKTPPPDRFRRAATSPP